MQMQQGDHDEANDQEGVSEVEGGPPAGVQEVGDLPVTRAVDHVCEGAPDHSASGESFAAVRATRTPTGKVAPMLNATPELWASRS